MQANNLPPHLGGHLYKTHIDESSLDYLIDRYNVESMCDIGCGPGGMVKLAQDRGLKSFGVDGDFTLSYPEEIDVIVHDFTTGPLGVDQYDLAWSCEFLEHVKEEYADNYFSVFCKSRVVCCTFSISRAGHHHVNVKNQDYWDDRFFQYGFEKDEDATQEIRSVSSMKRNFMRDVGSVYMKRT